MVVLAVLDNTEVEGDGDDDDVEATSTRKRAYVWEMKWPVL